MSKEIDFRERANQYFNSRKNLDISCGINDFCTFVGITYDRFMMLVKFQPLKCDLDSDPAILDKIEFANECLDRIIADIERRAMEGKIPAAVYLYYMTNYRFNK